MTYRKTAVAIVVALGLGAAHASAQVATIGDLLLGHGTAGLAVDPVSRKAFVSNYNSGTLSVIDVDTLTTAQYPVGANPRRLAHDANLQRTYIVNDTRPGRVTVFDAMANQVLIEIPVGARPRTISADFARGEVYVANLDSNTMSVISTTSNQVVAEVSVGSSPFMGDVDSVRGRIYVVSQADRAVHVIDQVTRQVIGRIDTLAFPQAATVDRRTGKVYVNGAVDNVVQVVDPDTLLTRVQLPVGGLTSFGATSDVYRRYYLPSMRDDIVTVIDTDTDEIVRVVPTGRSPQQILSDGSGGNWYVVNQIGNSVTVFDSRNDQSVAAFATQVNPWRIGVGVDRVFVLNQNGAARDSVTIAHQLDTLAGTTVAGGWYHADFDHYFHTTGEVESRLLGDGLFGNAWDRTYDYFRVWTEQGPNRVQVCRFLSTAFGQKSSHFHTASADECETVKKNPHWQFEAMAYYVELPDGMGGCRAGTVPLFRLYNNGTGGAPNHLFTASSGVRDSAAGKGWTLEGVAACVPSLRGDEL
jgi:YVTN family beta-propeller protein